MDNASNSATPVGGLVQTHAYQRLDAIIATTQAKMDAIRAYLAHGPLEPGEWEQWTKQYRATRDVYLQATRDREFLVVMWEGKSSPI